MKTILRKIIVQGQEFKWAIKHSSDIWLALPDANFQEDHVFIRIWVVNQKTKPWVEIKYKFNNPWRYYGEIITYSGDIKDLQKKYQFDPVTPGLVAGMIESVLKQSSLPEKVISTQCFSYKNKTLEAVSGF